MNLMDSAQGLLLDTDKPRTQGSGISGVQTTIRVFLPPSDFSPTELFRIIVTLFMIFVGLQADTPRIGFLISILALLDQQPEKKIKELCSIAGLKPIIKRLSWGTDRSVQHGNRGHLFADLVLDGTEEEKTTWNKMKTQGMKIIDLVFKEDYANDTVHDRKFFYQQLWFALSKGVTNPKIAVEFVMKKAAQIVTQERGNACYQLSANSLEVLVGIIKNHLSVRKAMVDITISAMESTNCDDVLSQIALSGKYMRQTGMTAFNVACKYGILGGYSEVRNEKLLTGDVAQVILAIKTLKQKGLKGQLMYFINDPDLAEMSVNKFKNLFSFSLGVGRILDPTLSDYAVNSSIIVDRWYALGNEVANRENASSTDSTQI